VARQTGADSSFVPRAEEALDRMRRLLDEGEEQTPERDIE
jgi:hypothetical protein